MKITKELNFILSAIVPVSKRGVIAANINWNLTNNIPGIVGAYCSKGASDGTPLRKTQSMPPIKPVSDSPNDKLNPKTNHITLNIAKPKKICMKIDAAFFFLKRPDSKSPNAGIINKTRLPAINIHAVSPESSTIIEKNRFLINNNI
jgi:hypothetical protein